jgi:hypothetical protein
VTLFGMVLGVSRMNRWLRNVAVGIALCLPVAAFAHILPIIARDAEYNQSGEGILTYPMAST